MYNINRVIKKLTPHRSAAELFKYFSDEKDCVFLDSSLVNGLGRYSIIGVRPYLKLVKDDHGFFINEQKVSELSFEEYLKKYLSEHKDQNKSGLPMLSGAIGYFSYEYGRKLMEIPSHKENLVTIPDAVLVFLMVDKQKVEQAIRLLLEGIGEDTEREGLKDTPDRIARMCMEIYGGLDEEADHHLAKQFEVENNEMVLEKDITFYSMCEHHLMPFYGKAHVAYIPNGKVTGLSKLARTVDVYARRPQIQERLTVQIADALERTLNPKGIMVMLEAEHTCMTMRGIKKPGSKTITTVTRGDFKTDRELQKQFLSMVKD